MTPHEFVVPCERNQFAFKIVMPVDDSVMRRMSFL